MERLGTVKRNFFSIIIPTYNQANFLKEALDSIIKQTYNKWEALIVDNYSSDKTQDVIKSFSDKRIKEFKLRNNGVIAASRNYGIKKSKGNFICFLDSDDYWFSNKLEVINDLLQSDYNFVSNGEIWMKNRIPQSLKRYRNKNDFIYERLLFFGNNLSTSAITVQKDFLIKNKCFSIKKEFVGIEDYDLWLRLANDKSKNYFCIEKPLGVFRIHDKGNSRKLKRQFSSEINVLINHFKNYDKKLKIIKTFFIFLRVLKLLVSYFIIGNLKILKDKIYSL